MNWSSSTLRAAAEIQAEIERLSQTLAELLQTEGVPATASKGRVNPATVPTTSAPGGKSGNRPLGPAASGHHGSDVDGAPLSPSELLDGLLFWGDGFSSSKPNNTRQSRIYHLHGLKRLDSGSLLTGLESP